MQQWGCGAVVAQVKDQHQEELELTGEKKSGKVERCQFDWGGSLRKGNEDVHKVCSDGGKSIVRG